MTPERIAVFGGSSAIAHASMKGFAQDACEIALIGRDPDKLQSVAQDLKVRGAQVVHIITADLSDSNNHAQVLQSCLDSLKVIDRALICYGSLGNQTSDEKDTAATERELTVNFLSQATLLTHLAQIMEKQKSGQIAIVSSVAGDRGRASNYIYGSAKAGITAFAAGMRARLRAHKIQVLTVKPGFIATPMTAHLSQGPLFASADRAGQLIEKAMRNRRDCVYVPGFWRAIMFVIRHIPEILFKRLPL